MYISWNNYYTVLPEIMVPQKMKMYIFTFITAITKPPELVICGNPTK